MENREALPHNGIYSTKCIEFLVILTKKINFKLLTLTYFNISGNYRYFNLETCLLDSLGQGSENNGSLEASISILEPSPPLPPEPSTEINSATGSTIVSVSFVEPPGAPTPVPPSAAESTISPVSVVTLPETSASAKRKRTMEQNLVKALNNIADEIKENFKKIHENDEKLIEVENRKADLLEEYLREIRNSNNQR